MNKQIKKIKRIFFVVDQDGRIQEVCLTKTSAWNWISKYLNAIPIEGRENWIGKHSIVAGEVNLSKLDLVRLNN